MLIIQRNETGAAWLPAIILSCFTCAVALGADDAGDVKVQSPPAASQAETDARDQLRKSLEKQESNLRMQHEKLKKLFDSGAVSLREVDKAKEDLEKVRQQLATLVKDSGGPQPVEPPVLQVDPLQFLAQQIQKTVEEIEQQRNALKSLMASLKAASTEIANVTEVLNLLIVERQTAKQTVHPLIIAARDYLNVPYEFGGTSAEGIDCSGLVYKSLATIGIDAPRTAAALFGFGKEVALTEMQPGDLVFFANTYKPGISHIGIFLGSDRFLHASGRDKGVIISSLVEKYYIEHFAGVRHVTMSEGK